MACALRREARAVLLDVAKGFIKSKVWHIFCFPFFAMKHLFVAPSRSLKRVPSGGGIQPHSFPASVIQGAALPLPET